MQEVHQRHHDVASTDQGCCQGLPRCCAKLASAVCSCEEGLRYRAQLTPYLHNTYNCNACNNVCPGIKQPQCLLPILQPCEQPLLPVSQQCIKRVLCKCFEYVAETDAMVGTQFSALCSTVATHLMCPSVTCISQQQGCYTVSNAVQPHTNMYGRECCSRVSTTCLDNYAALHL